MSVLGRVSDFDVAVKNLLNSSLSASVGPADARVWAFGPQRRIET
jgi:hypothetical protein